MIFFRTLSHDHGPSVLERFRAISNPLTVIAIFAGLAEVATTAALAAVDPGVQRVFIWFVMGFPTLLVSLFFITLNFNPKVLYAPSDFQDEGNFLALAFGGQRLTSDLDAVAQRVDEVRKELVPYLRDQLSTDSRAGLKALQEQLSTELHAIRNQIAKTRDSANELFTEATETAFPQSGLQANILSVISSRREGADLQQIATEIGMSQAATSRAVSRLEKRGLIARKENGNFEVARAPRKSG